MRRLVLSTLALLLATPALAAPLRIQDSAGKPVRGAELRSIADAAAPALRSDAEGLADAPAGLLRIEASGFLPWEGEAAGTVVLTRESRVIVRAVERETGTAVGNGRVRLWAREDGRAGTDFLEPPPEEPPVAEAALVEGRAELAGLPGGTYRVQVEADGYLALGRAVAPAPESTDEITLRLWEASVAEGRVLRGGKPVADAKLRVMPALPEEMARWQRRGRGGGGGGMMRAFGAFTAIEIKSDAAGRFRFDQLPAERRMPFLLIAQAPDFSWGFATVPATPRGSGNDASARTVALDLTMEPGTAVSGVALWSDGEPAAGVPVVAELEQETRGWRGPRRIGVSLQPVFEEWGGGPETVTGPEGEFTLPGLPPANWRLVAQPFEHAPSEPLELALLRGEAAPSNLVIEIARGFGVEGIVVDPSGNGVPDAEIVGELRRDGSRWPEQALDTTTDGKGRFAISGFDPGELTLRVNAPGFGNKRIEVGPVAEAGRQRIELTRTGRLFGTAFNAVSGEPLTRFRVVAVRADDEGDSRVNRFRGRQAGPEIVSEDGTFELDEIEEGRWAVLVRAEGFLTRVSEPAEVRAGELSDVGRVELAPGAVVTGRVEDADTRESIEGATVTVEGIDGAGGGRFGFQRRGWGRSGQAPTDTTDAQGAFRLDGIPPGEFTVTVTHHAYPMSADHSARVSIGEDPAAALPTLVLEMEAGGGITGRVLDSSGRPEVGAVVVATEPHPRGRGSVVGGPVDADAEGVFAIEALPAGEVMVRRADRMDGGVKVQVRKGEVAEVTLQDNGVRVFGGLFVEGRSVEGRVRLLAGSWGAPRTDWGTTYELLGVPPGEWTLRVDIRDADDPAAPLREERIKIVVTEDLTELPFDINLEAEDRTDDAVLEGRVVDIDTGEGLGGWLINARADGGLRETTRSEEDGSFRLTLTESGDWRVNAMATSNDPPYDTPDAIVVTAEGGRLVSEPPVFQAKRRLEVEVTVKDLAGAPVQGAICALVNKAQHLSPQAGLRMTSVRGLGTDALGTTTVSASEPGPQDLMVVLPSRALVFETGVNVGGIGQVEVQLPRTGTLEVRGARELDLLGLPGGWWMKLRANQNRYGLLETRGDTLLLHGLPGGDYQVRVGGEVRSVEIVPGPVATVVDFSS